MAKFKQFQYSESLTGRSLNALPEFLRVNSRSLDEIILFRLLSGTLKVKNKFKRTKFEQRINYFNLDYIYNGKISAKLIKDILKLNTIRPSKLEEYYNSSIRYGNKVYFESLLLEVTNYFYQKENKSHATAFLHLYRATELISYCFPLYYASRSTSYEKTYTSLKDFFAKADGEVSFFKNFVNVHLFKDDQSLLDVNLEISINSTSVDLDAQYFKAIKKLCDKNKNITLNHSTPNSKIVISRRGLTSLIFDLRNRYFHLLAGDYNDNFSSMELAEIDEFYKCVNEHILNWIAVIYLEVLSQKVD
ncbi:hypothetical protein [Pedobacter hartonius]|uniref:Uncharacterized protein n=1 Tax=Pedobacter hartonius TaxID=425514 RepID=A0A1H4DW20_9SPHI|nr:hypothetical protein [Pedobacter hartonius]SEA76590.1 hypothetical protein SAMN05443550_105118 [Pedobacter hartonius]